MENEMQVQEINGAVALKMEPSDLGSLWRRITRFIASLVEAELKRQKRRLYESALAELPDYLLADVGLRRSDLVYARRRELPDDFTIFLPRTLPRALGGPIPALREMEGDHRICIH